LTLVALTVLSVARGQTPPGPDATTPAPAPAEKRDGLVYVIPIKGMIERGLVYVIRRGVAQAVRQRADAVVFDMDTPGGRLDAAEELVNIVGGLPIKTCVYVNPNAISAGAILSFATDAIYMAPGSRIGDAMPIMMAPLGTPQEMPEAIEEKSVSYVASLIRSAAQRKGHDAQLAEAMVRRTKEYKIGDQVINPPKQLLTLTNVEAEQLVDDGKGGRRPLLSLGTRERLSDVLASLGLAGARTVELRVTAAEKIARFVEAFSVLFLVGGVLGLYIEFKTPGFGLPGVLGISLLAIWFWGYHVAGLAGGAEILLFVAGVTLLAVEIFILPGFGVAGFSGLALVLLALGMAMVEHYPGLPAYSAPPLHLRRAILNLSGTLIAATTLGALLARFLPKTRAFDRVALATAVAADAGYTASDETTDLVGLRGVAITALRPAGIGVFEGRRMDVVSRGDFLEAGTRIEVAEAHGNRVVVTPL
jgi:membrane-bound serine protease (ClpP class)